MMPVAQRKRPVAKRKRVSIKLWKRDPCDPDLYARTRDNFKFNQGQCRDIFFLTADHLCDLEPEIERFDIPGKKYTSGKRFNFTFGDLKPKIIKIHGDDYIEVLREKHEKRAKRVAENNVKKQRLNEDDDAEQALTKPTTRKVSQAVTKGTKPTVATIPVDDTIQY
ncbi:hypothetical protein C8J56DRAFT_251334 [Mycena floridula]|nr:hypothetical protein C8J56DRAFT_251334 [Mycena floridula]